jgi:hypothetical protein
MVTKYSVFIKHPALRLYLQQKKGTNFSRKRGTEKKFEHPNHQSQPPQYTQTHTPRKIENKCSDLDEKAT